MNNKYIISIILIILVIIFATLIFVDIPSPSKIVRESYELKIK